MPRQQTHHRCAYVCIQEDDGVALILLCRSPTPSRRLSDVFHRVVYRIIGIRTDDPQGYYEGKAGGTQIDSLLQRYKGRSLFSSAAFDILGGESDVCRWRALASKILASAG